MPNLAVDICRLCSERGATDEEGASAVATVLIATLMDRGFEKKHAVKMIEKMWDAFEPRYAQFRKQGGSLQ